MLVSHHFCAHQVCCGIGRTIFKQRMNTQTVEMYIYYIHIFMTLSFLLPKILEVVVTDPEKQQQRAEQCNFQNSKTYNYAIIEQAQHTMNQM